ncbi:MAG: hypothetical protein K9J12_15985 [Melioribacteraceae bacterium]|nr:hypothetical protein [Melioribacteraceae bacterium]MCF8265278.1 hypothetical protein [Melioribacteraceae bacterium]MCF8412607.1 hypothetical protein [Melioribacteraceae bacterium]MCF8431509.1 hypothetical protein [Melioribacteraceae bacterium]
MKKNILEPGKAGLGGFLLFLAVIMFTKLIGYWVTGAESIDITFTDILLGFIGFILMFLMKFLEKFKKI